MILTKTSVFNMILSERSFFSVPYFIFYVLLSFTSDFTDINICLADT